MVTLEVFSGDPPCPGCVALVALAMAYYMHLGFKPNSPVQRPESLYRQKKLGVLVGIAFGACAVLLLTDIPIFQKMIIPRKMPPESARPIDEPPSR